jgi:hypothetical protein
MRLPFMVFRSPAARVRVVLVLACAGILLALLLSKKPWDVQMPPPGVAGCVAVYGWWAGAFNALVLALAALLAPWWAGGEARPVVSSTGTGVPRWFWPLVFAAVAVCAAANGPRLAAGLWDDETYSVRHTIAGEWKIRDDGTLRFKKAPWRDTLWFFAKPNNHILNSVFARLANDAWAGVTRPQGLPFSEPVIRLPAFLAGLGSLAAFAWLLARLGLPGAGVLAAWLMALHPWHARFVPEVRAYAFLFLLLPLACLAVLRALETGAWRWWLASAAAQLALIAAWSGALGSLVLLNAGVACAIAFAGSDPAACGTSIARFLASCTLAGTAALQLYLPCVPQFQVYAEKLDDLHIDASWIVNVSSRFLTGHSWDAAYSGNRLDYLEGAHMFAQSPWAFVAVAVAGVLGLVLGIVRLARRGFPALAFLPALVLPAPLMVAAAMGKGIHLFEWYVVGALPGVLAVTAAGLAWAAGCVADRSNKAAALGLVVVGLAAFAWVNRLPWRTLWCDPVAPIRESVLLTRPSTNPLEPGADTILTASRHGPPHVYDPRAIVFKSHEKLREIINDACRTGKPLFVNQSYTNMAFAEEPEIAALLLDPELFERTTLRGVEPMFTRDVFRHTGKSLPGP